MSILLATLNSKFIHTNLAIRYLRAYTRDIADVKIKEFTINQNIGEILTQIYMLKPDLVGFSTYIWNIDETLEICEALKLVSPETKILLGGPEVSYDPTDIMNRYTFIDYIIFGEGEETFKELIEGKDLSHILGLVYRENNNPVKNNNRDLIKNLDTIPFPYDIDDDFNNKIIYYESSRGCPFDCQFCLSSTIKGLRFFPIERVKKEIDFMISLGVSQVKFVDRTFNARKDYSREIMDHIVKRDPTNINFHFEVTAHLIDDKQLEFLSNIKEGLFQFEIGVQSTNPKTIEAIGRITDFGVLKEVSTKIKSFKNIHQHLDLIAGLPFEDYNSFEKSFNDIYTIRPEKIQLGFLKLLKGSGLREDQSKYEFKFLDKAPYEILENKYITFGEIIRLKYIEEMVEKYYNEEFFKTTIEYIITNHYDSPFKFYEELSLHFLNNDLFNFSHSRTTLYVLLLEFLKENKEIDLSIVTNLLRYDYILNNTDRRIPQSLKSERIVELNLIHLLLKDYRTLELLPKEISAIPTKHILKKITLSFFDIDVLSLIQSGYNKKVIKIDTLILFYHSEGTITRSNSFNMTEIYKELIN